MDRDAPGTDVARSAIAAAADPFGDLLRIRPATPSDGPALLELALACPVHGRLVLASERGRDFSVLVRARGRGSTLVAELDGRVVACGSLSRRAAYVLGEATTIGCLGDLRVLPGYRRTGLAHRIMAELIAADRGAPPTAYVGAAAAGDRAVEALLGGLAPAGRFLRLGTFTAWWLLPFAHRRHTPASDSHQATATDEDELVQFLDDYHRALTPGPVFAAGGFRRMLARSPGMGLGSYRIARRNGRIVAALATWDASTVNPLRVLRLPRPLRWASRAAHGPGRLLRLPRIPTEGELLRRVYLRHAACARGALPQLARLVRAAVAELSGADIQFAVFTCPAGDPGAACVRWLPRIARRYVLHAFTPEPASAARLRAVPGTPLYDDAALW